MLFIIHEGYSNERNVNSVPVQSFWHFYWEYKEEKHPKLKMKKPGIVPQKSDWPMMHDDRLNNIVFLHKLRQGNVDATFSGFSEEVESRIKETLPEWAEFKRHKKSFSIRVFSGKVDSKKSFIDQVVNVEKGLQNIEKMRDWIIENV